MKIEMNIPDSEKKALVDFNLSIPKLSKRRYRPSFHHQGYFIQKGHITRLILKGLKLTCLPNSIGNLKNLQRLELNDNHLNILPESFKDLKKLKYLNLNKNFFTSMPDSIGDLKELRHLELKGNHLKNIPKSLQKLNNLEQLQLRGNKFTSLPDWIGNLKNLRYLILTSNQLSNLPESFKNLNNLEHLELDGNKFTSLPDWFGSLKNLRSLSLGVNKLYSLPETIGNLENLDWLGLSHNQISIFPESFKNLTKLLYLGIEKTGLRSFSNIPWEFFEQIDIFNDSWQCLISGNYPSKKAEDIFYGSLYDFWSYYRVSPIVLAQKYANDQGSLTSDEKERLAWEGGFRERAIIELGVKADDLILAEINKRLIISCSNGIELIK